MLLKKREAPPPPPPLPTFFERMDGRLRRRENISSFPKKAKKEKKERDKTAVFSSFLLGLSFLSLFPPPPPLSTPGG